MSANLLDPYETSVQKRTICRQHEEVHTGVWFSGPSVALEVLLYSVHHQHRKLQGSAQHKGKEVITGTAFTPNFVILLTSRRTFKYLLINLLSS